MHTRIRTGDFCERCGVVDLRGRSSTRRYCAPCLTLRAFDTGAAQARYAVSRAVARGDLPPAKDCACVDCGKPARDYDHRDNNKPLDVQPVCRSCNKLRGPARPVLTFELPEVAKAGA